MIKEPITTIKGYVLAIDFMSISRRFVEKINRVPEGIFILDCSNVEDALIFNNEAQAKSWCLIINKELEDQHSPDSYIPLRYMSGLQELEENDDV